MSKLLLIDSHAIIHRAFHSIPKQLTYQGKPVNAMYGFYSMLYTALDTLNPKYLVFCLDAPGPTFRDAEYIAYRAQRKPSDPDLKRQFPIIIDSLENSGLTHFSLGGYEADDILATISKSALKKKKSLNIYIITGDKDLMQLVNDKVQLCMPVKGLTQTKTYDPQAVKERLGVRPDQVVDQKALMGDPSDNYPGVSGIGPKTATDLLSKYDNLDNVYKHLDDIKPNLKTKLERDKDNAYLSQKLAQLEYQVPIKFSLKQSRLTNDKIDKLIEIFKLYNFKSLVARFSRKYQINTKQDKTNSTQPTLF